MPGETISYNPNPEKAGFDSNRVNLEAVFGYMEALAEAGVNADFVVRQGLSTLIKADLKNY